VLSRFRVLYELSQKSSTPWLRLVTGLLVVARGQPTEIRAIRTAAVVFIEL
jgi:hypothetical protein